MSRPGVVTLSLSRGPFLPLRRYLRFQGGDWRPSSGQLTGCLGTAPSLSCLCSPLCSVFPREVPLGSSCTVLDTSRPAPAVSSGNKQDLWFCVESTASFQGTRSRSALKPRREKEAGAGSSDCRRWLQQLGGRCWDTSAGRWECVQELLALCGARVCLRAWSQLLKSSVCRRASWLFGEILLVCVWMLLEIKPWFIKASCCGKWGNEVPGLHCTNRKPPEAPFPSTWLGPCSLSHPFLVPVSRWSL